MSLSFKFADGKREQLSEAELDAICDVLWSSDDKGALPIAVKISHERRRPQAMQDTVTLTESEGDPFTRAVVQVREPTSRRTA